MEKDVKAGRQEPSTGTSSTETSSKSVQRAPARVAWPAHPAGHLLHACSSSCMCASNEAPHGQRDYSHAVCHKAASGIRAGHSKASARGKQL